MSIFIVVAKFIIAPQVQGCALELCMLKSKNLRKVTNAFNIKGKMSPNPQSYEAK